MVLQGAGCAELLGRDNPLAHSSILQRQEQITQEVLRCFHSRAQTITKLSSSFPRQAESGRVRTLEERPGTYQGVYDTTAVLERPVGRRLVPILSLVCRAEVHALTTQVEANVEVHEHSGSAPLFLLNTGELDLFHLLSLRRHQPRRGSYFPWLFTSMNSEHYRDMAARVSQFFSVSHPK